MSGKRPARNEKAVRKERSGDKKKATKKKATRKKHTAGEKTRDTATDPGVPETLPPPQFLERLLAGHGATRGAGRRRPVDVAQEIMYEAWEAPTAPEAIQLALRALEVSRDCADAYVLLAQEMAGSLEEAIALYAEGVAAGERALGKKAFREDVGYFWGILETRPYMRARAGLAQCLEEAGRLEEAAAHYRDMLRLNPGDNQGIRHLLMPCLVLLGRDREAEELFEEYAEDGTSAWLYARALLDFRRTGDSESAARSLAAALDANPHVPALLLGRRKLPDTLPRYYGFGDENEAVLYARGNRRAWQETPGALEWLASRAG